MPSAAAFLAAAIRRSRPDCSRGLASIEAVGAGISPRPTRPGLNRAPQELLAVPEDVSVGALIFQDLGSDRSM